MTEWKSYAWLGINNHDFIYYVQTKLSVTDILYTLWFKEGWKISQIVWKKSLELRINFSLLTLISDYFSDLYS